MYPFGSSQTADETTWASRVFGIVFDEFSLQQSGFNLVDIQIIFQPFLLGMNTDLITTCSNQLSDFLDGHS
jgi:hypothetical protein